VDEKVVNIVKFFKNTGKDGEKCGGHGISTTPETIVALMIDNEFNELSAGFAGEAIKALKRNNLLNTTGIEQLARSASPGDHLDYRPDKKGWTEKYLYYLMFRAVELNNADVYLHLNEVSRHVNKKKIYKKIRGDILTVLGMYAMVLSPIIILAILRKIFGGGDSSGGSPETDE
jgi:hypothetical protein